MQNKEEFTKALDEYKKTVGPRRDQSPEHSRLCRLADIEFIKKVSNIEVFGLVVAISMNHEYIKCPIVHSYWFTADEATKHRTDVMASDKLKGDREKDVNTWISSFTVGEIWFFDAVDGEFIEPPADIADQRLSRILGMLDGVRRAFAPYQRATMNAYRDLREGQIKQEAARLTAERALHSVKKTKKEIKKH